MNMILLRKACIFLGLLLCLVPWGLTQNLNEREPEINKDHKYVVTGVHYNIKGFVTIAALKDKIELKEESEFESLQALVDYVKDRRNVLVSLDALSRTMSTITFTHEWNEKEKQYDVQLFVYVTAGNTFFVLPYFKYSTDAGLTLAARIRDYNFVGSLDTLKINLDYNIDWDDAGTAEQKLLSSFSLAYPFNFGKHGFNLSLRENFEYVLGDIADVQEVFRTVGEKDFKNDVSIGLGYGYPLLQRIGYNASISQSIYSRIEDSGTSKYNFGETEARTGLNFGLTKNPLPLIKNISYGLYVKYRQDYPISASEYLSSGNDPNETRINGLPGVGHSIGFGSISKTLNGFFREGITFSLGNDYEYNIRQEGWYPNVNAEFKGFGTAWNRIGFSTRVYGKQNLYFYSDTIDITNYGDSLDGRMRGILSGDFGNGFRYIIVNSDFLVNMFQIRLNTLFSAEFHGGPFFDVGMRQRVSDQFNIDEDFKYTTGIEGIANHLYYSGIRIRASYGFDLGKTIDDNTEEDSSFIRGVWNNKEIQIGLSLFY